MNLETLREFLGWCTVINFGILLLSTAGILGARKAVARLHGRMFGMMEADLSRIYFQYLSWTGPASARSSRRRKWRIRRS